MLVEYYQNNKTTDGFYSLNGPYHNFIKNKVAGNCSEMSEMLAYLLEAEGIKTDQVTLTQFDHRLLRVSLENSSIIFCDPWAGVIYTEDTFTKCHGSNWALKFAKEQIINTQPEEIFFDANKKEVSKEVSYQNKPNIV